MAIAFVKCTEILSASSNVASGTVSATAGNALIVCATGYSSNATTFTVSGGGTWTTNNQGLTGNNMGAGFASCLSATGGSATITVTYAAGTAAVTAFVLEFSGVASASAFESAASALATGSGTTKTSPALTNTQADAVKVASTVVDSVSTSAFTSSGTGWTMPTNGEEDSAANLVAACGYKIVSASQSDTQSWTRSGTDNWAAHIATYKAAAGGGAQDTPELYGPPRLSARQMQQLLAQ